MDRGAQEEGDAALKTRVEVAVCIDTILINGSNVA